MADTSGATPQRVDLTRPSVARMYDFYLGGSHNFEVDREAARIVLAAAPDVITAARANRSFLRRVVTFAIDRGIHQFLDLGSGIPTVGSVHEIAFARNDATQIVYVDHDPIAVVHAQLLLAGDPRVTVLSEDIRQLPQILARAGDVLDFRQPVAVLLVSVAHFIPGDITALLAPLRGALAAGSVLAISPACLDPGTYDPQRALEVRKVYDATPDGIHLRTADQIRAMFTGFTLIPARPDQPAGTPTRLVVIDAWQPSPYDYREPSVAGFLAGVGILASPATTDTGKTR
jgi:hypothetical protein